MTSHAPRRFRITDGLVLIAATAIGLAWTRPMGVWLSYWHPPWNARQSWEILGSLLVLGFPCSLTSGIALLILGSRVAPTPRRRRFRRPGILACFLATLLTFAQALVVLGILSARWLMTGHFLADPKGYATRNGILMDGLLFVVPAFGPVILAGWIALWLNGRWCPEPSWIDRSGRFLGVYWIITGINICVTRASIDMMSY